MSQPGFLWQFVGLVSLSFLSRGNRLKCDLEGFDIGWLSESTSAMPGIVFYHWSLRFWHEKCAPSPMFLKSQATTYTGVVQKETKWQRSAEHHQNRGVANVLEAFQVVDVLCMDFALVLRPHGPSLFTPISKTMNANLVHAFVQLYRQFLCSKGCKRHFMVRK